MKFPDQVRSCHPERSEGSRCPAKQILRGVYPERSEGLRMTDGGRGDAWGCPPGFSLLCRRRRHAEFRILSDDLYIHSLRNGLVVSPDRFVRQKCSGGTVSGGDLKPLRAKKSGGLLSRPHHKYQTGLTTRLITLLFARSAR